MWRAGLPHGGRRAGRITSGVLPGSGRDREGRESARAAARLPAPGEGKHAPAHAPLRAPKITRARRRPPPRAASPQAGRPRGLAAMSLAPTPRRPKHWRHAEARRSRGAPGLPAPPKPVSPLWAQPRPRAAGDGPRAHRDLPAAIASRASRRPLQAAGTRPGPGRGRPLGLWSSRPGQRAQVVPHRQLSVIGSHPRPEAQRARGSAAPGVQPQPRTRNPVPSHPVPAGLPRWRGPIFYAETVLLRALGLLNSTDMMTACQDLG